MANLRRASDYVKQQGSNNRPLYNSYRWTKYSLAYRKAHRLCVRCKAEGRTVVSQCVDHIIPIEEGGAIWDASNHQALCYSCHSKKTIDDRAHYRTQHGDD